jgi:hypothetical protein
MTFARGDSDLPLPKPVRRMMLAPNHRESWQMSAKQEYITNANALPERGAPPQCNQSGPG